jgi:hypothetical protein
MSDDRKPSLDDPGPEFGELPPEAANGVPDDDEAGERIQELDRYRRRKRMLAAIGLGAFGALIVFGVLEATDRARNPCARARDYFCKKDPASSDCTSYVGLTRDSVEEESKMARQAILHQCDTRIRLLKRDEGIDVP